MKEPYIEGIANHSGLESCVGARKGVDEALTKVRAGGAIEPRNDHTRSADALTIGRRQAQSRRYTQVGCELRAVEEHRHARDISMRENREVQ